MLLAYVRTRIQQRFYFFAVTSVTEGEKWEFNSSPYKVLFFQKQRIVFNKTTYRFQQNNVSFSIKQRVVFNKTTCHFQQNNVSFSTKQRIVFNKTTCRFQANNVAFSTKQRVVCKSSTPFSFFTLRTTKSFFRRLFGGLTHHKSKQMFTNTYNKQNINLLYWTLWHLWQQKYKNFFYVCAHIRARGGKQQLLTPETLVLESPYRTLFSPIHFHSFYSLKCSGHLIIFSYLCPSFNPNRSLNSEQISLIWV